MHTHTKSTFFVLAFIGLGILLWWWLPTGDTVPQSADRTGDEQEVSDDDTVVTDPVPAEPNPPTPDMPPTEPGDRNDTTSAPVLEVSTNSAGVLQAEIVATLDMDGQASAVCGPISFGEIAWGDGASESVYGLGCSAAQQTLDISHQYSTAGEYTITFTDQQQVEATQTITVRGNENDGAEPTLEVEESNRSVTVVVRGVEDETGPVAVDGPIVFGDISWGDGSATDRISGLSSRPSNPVTHEYMAAGEYTISVTLTSGEILERTLTVD